MKKQSKVLKVPQLEEAIQQVLQEAAPSYTMAGGRKPLAYGEFLSNKMLLIATIRAGIPYKLFSLIRENTPFSEQHWAEFLGLSAKSLQRYRSEGKHRFKPIHSEKILELAEVTQAGLEVFGNMDKLRLWLETPNYALGNMKPLELLRDSYGKELVLCELVRINYGILA